MLILMKFIANKHLINIQGSFGKTPKKSMMVKSKVMEEIMERSNGFDIKRDSFNCKMIESRQARNSSFGRISPKENVDLFVPNQSKIKHRSGNIRLKSLAPPHRMDNVGFSLPREK